MAVIGLATLAIVTVAADEPKPSTGHTDVIFLDALSAEAGVTLYERVIGFGPGTHVAVGADPRSIVAHDTPERLARFRVLVSMLDHGGEKLRLFVRPVVHLAPSRLATLLLDITNPKARATFTLVPDDRSSKLVVRANAPVYDRLDTLIRRLDVPARAARRVHVVPAPEGE